MGSFFQIPKKTKICKTGIITSISIYHFNGKKRIRNNQKKIKIQIILFFEMQFLFKALILIFDYFVLDMSVHYFSFIH